jgi:hypothetical protein
MSLTPPDDKHSIAAKREMYEALTTPQPSPRDIEQAAKLLFGEDDNPTVYTIAQALAQREAEVRAEYAALAARKEET